MSDQPTLGAFTETDNTSSSPDSALPDTNTEDATAELQTPDAYPSSAVTEYGTESMNFNLCVADGTVETTFKSIAGDGGMGPGTPIDHPDQVLEIANKCIGGPVILSGGGMGMVGGSGLAIGQLLEAELEDDTVRVTIDPLWRPNGRARDRERGALLGSYELAVPASTQDCANAVTALTDWMNDDIEFLEPAAREAAEETKAILKEFSRLTPDDRIDTPAYTTTLTVLSEPFETYAVEPRMYADDKTIPVVAVTVDNPRGGYYQLGITPTTGTETPTCYMSGSESSPPRPNTAFTRDKTFSGGDLTITATAEADVEVVEPDQEVLTSPLPEPRLQTSLKDIHGIGKSTARTLRDEYGPRITADELAHSLFGSGDLDTDPFWQVIKSLPKKSAIVDEIRSLSPD